MSKMAKFCANLSFMFKEHPYLERFGLAHSAGFKAVESGFPLGHDAKDVKQALEKAKLRQILLNVYTGDVTKGELGFAAIPGKEKEFLQSLDTTLAYAKEIGIPKVHVMSGLVKNPTQENEQVYIANLKQAAKLFETHNIIGLIEPINNYTVPNYYLHSYDTALKVVKEVNSPNLKIMADIFHVEHIGNITKTLEKIRDHIGHVQIAQTPSRNEPGAHGEINYRYVFSLLEEIGYKDWIGLEYLVTVKDTVRWIKDFGYEL